MDNPTITSSLQVNLPAAGYSAPVPTNLREASQEFESLFISQMMAAMRSTVPESSLMGSSEPVRHAISLAQANPAAVAALGTPLEPGMMINGTLQTDNSSGHADLSMPLKGPKGSGRVYIKGEREADRWTYSLIELAIDASGDRIDLLGGAGAAGESDQDTNDRLEVPPDIDQPPVEHSEPADAPEHEQPSETAPERSAHAG